MRPRSSWKNNDSTASAARLGHAFRSHHRRRGTESSVTSANDPTDTDPNRGSIRTSSRRAKGVSDCDQYGVVPAAQRDGVSTDLQWKPNDAFELNFTGRLYVTESSQLTRAITATGPAARPTPPPSTSEWRRHGGSYGPGASTPDGYERESRSIRHRTAARRLAVWLVGDEAVSYPAHRWFEASGCSSGLRWLQLELDGQRPQINFSPNDATAMLAHGAGFASPPATIASYQTDFHDVSGPLNQIEVGIKATNT